MSKKEVNLNLCTDKRTSLNKGIVYLAISLIVLVGLSWFFPDVLGIDLAAMLRGKTAISLFRILLGAFFLVILVFSIRYVIASFTLTGQGWRDGLDNAIKAHILSRDGVSIILLGIIGFALVVWGLVDLI